MLGTCSKYTDNIGEGKGSSSSDSVTATLDSVFLLSEFEITGTSIRASTYEAWKQQQYPYFENGNSNICYNHSSISEPCKYWIRSPWANYFACILEDGRVNANAPNVSLGIFVAFIVG